jgi:hypothetical protein
MDTTQDEKIYVAVGYDVVDGFQTLEWALKKWNYHPNIYIIILHVNYNTSNDHVYTLRKFSYLFMFLCFILHYYHLSSIWLNFICIL